MKRSPFLLLILFFLLLFWVDGAQALDSPRWLMEKRWAKQAEYEACMERRKEELAKREDARPFHNVLVQEGSNVELDCFECLDPIYEEALEDVWKPNESFIGRRVKGLLNKLREIARQMRKKPKSVRKEKLETLKTYRWERLPPDTTPNNKWSVVVSASEPGDDTEKAKMAIESVMEDRKSDFSLGNHFELDIRKANLSMSGWYRCIRGGANSKEKGSHTASVHYLDVLPVKEFPIQMREVKEDSFPSEAARNISATFSDAFEIYGHTSNWTPCNKCGNETEWAGEVRRRTECRIRALPSKSPSEIAASTNFPSLALFREINCLSSLVPAELKEALRQYPITEEFKSCQVPCDPVPEEETRIVEEVDQSGVPVVVDRLPPGEYSLEERLPPLKSSVRRRPKRGTEGESLVLDCKGRREGVFWHRDLEELNSSRLLADHPDGRVLITSRGQLIFKTLESKDDGYYTCYTRSEGLVRAFRLLVWPSSNTEHTVSYVKVGITYFVVLCMAWAIASTLLQADLEDGEGDGEEADGDGEE